MKRRMACVWLVAIGTVIGFMGVLSVGQTADPKAEKKPDAKPKKPVRVKSKSAALIKKLQTLISMEKGIDNDRTELEGFFDYFQDHYEITIVLNTQAFKDQGKPSAFDIAERFKVKGPGRVNNVPLGTVLHRLVSQVHGTYLIRNGIIEFTSLQAAAPERLLRQKVTAVFDKKPLNEALDQLGEATAVSVIVDARVAEMAAAPVTATLKNDVSLQTAVRLLADMAGLKAVRVGGTLYVTSKKNAKALQAEEKKIRKAGKRKAKDVEKPKTGKAK